MVFPSFLRLITYLIIPMILLGCSSFNNQQHSPRDFGVVVDVGAHPTASLEISNEGGEGPVIAENDDYVDRQEKKAKKVTAIVFGPGGNRTAAHVSFIKAMERHKLSAHIATGSGLGAVVATLYASGLRSDRIEWFFYKFFKETKGYQLFSSSWVDVVQKVLREEFGKRRIEELPIAVIIPLYDTEERRVQYFSRGPIVELLTENLKLSHNRQSRFLSSFQWEILPIRFLKSYGADVTIGVNVLGNEVLFDHWDDYLLGVFGKAIAMSKDSSKELDLNIDLLTGDYPIDGTKGIPLFIQKSYDVAYEKVDEYLKQMASEPESQQSH